MAYRERNDLASVISEIHTKFADSGSIGPPLPNVKELIDFIEFEIG